MTTPPATSNPWMFPKDYLRCHLVNRDPCIIISYGSPMAAPTQLCQHLAHRKVYFLLGNWWSLLDFGLLMQTKCVYSMLREQYPLHEFIFLTNAPDECRILERVGLPGYFCHHNAFLDERIFRPLPQVAKDLDAVYTARLSRFKRHLLARDIPSWGLLYYLLEENRPKQRAYLRHLQRLMPGMACPNHDPQTGQYRRLSAEEMCQAYNRARVGLCLSEAEGGNYAATEYLLCGLPVVSTKNQGGRDYFLDAENSRTIEPEGGAVARAVAELISLNLSPREIRLRALLKIREVRQDFIRLVGAILQREGCHENFADRFDSVFVHKMLTHPGTPEEFVAKHGLGPGQA